MLSNFDARFFPLIELCRCLTISLVWSVLGFVFELLRLLQLRIFLDDFFDDSLCFLPFFWGMVLSLTLSLTNLIDLVGVEWFDFGI